MPRPRQPFLHDLTTVFAAPTQVLSQQNGDIDGRQDRPTAQGVLHADVRVLSHAAVLVDGQPGEHTATDVAGGRARFTSLLRQVGADQVDTPDPRVRLDRVREVHPGLVTEHLTISSLLDAPVVAGVSIVFGSDQAPLELIREGAALAPRPFAVDPAGAGIEWTGQEVSARIAAEGATLSLSADRTLLAANWSVRIPARGDVAVSWQLIISDAGAAVVASRSRRGPRPGQIRATDHRLAPWLERSLDDLDGMRMGTAAHPDDTFLAAGVPWYLTLFGRDSLWSAKMLLPVDLGIAATTLSTLARFQGTKINIVSAEAPGKIPHELRRAAFKLGGMTLPPLYYGSIDATPPLWICLLHDAWRAGLADAEVSELLPVLERALGWLTGVADVDGDGFLEYVDTGGRGLANQGWKDSADAIRFSDGRIAEGSVALCEVQGLRVPGGCQRRNAAGGIRPPRCRPASRLGGDPGRSVPCCVLVRRRRRPLSRPGAGWREESGRFPHQQHRAPARHRTAERRGGATGGEGRPVPYPAACRPQAWSAASAVVVAQVLGAL